MKKSDSFDTATDSPLLDSINSPSDLKRLDEAKLPQLAQEIRDELINVLSQVGGHLGPNLGVVELTIALHRVFNTPADKLVFDVSHQGYVHKLLTGRRDRFNTMPAPHCRRRWEWQSPGIAGADAKTSSWLLETLHLHAAPVTKR
jgi:hypothetical protein